MISTIRPKFSIGDLLVLASIVVMLVAFLALPWLTLEDDSTVTGYDLVTDTDETIDVPAKISNMFLIVIPLAAVIGGVLALWIMLAPRYDHRLPTLILFVGLIAIGYYYGGFFYENHLNTKANAIDFVGSGFVVALIAAVGLLVQIMIPRPGLAAQATIKTVEPPGVNPAAIAPPADTLIPVWRRPFVWLGAQIRPYTSRLAHHLQLGKIPTLAYLIGLVGAAELESREGLKFARLLGFRKSPSLFGATEIFEPFSDLDFSGILTPFFPAPTDHFDSPISASWEAFRTLGQDFLNALTTQGPKEPGFFNVLIDVLEYDLVIFVIPIIVIALLLRGSTNLILVRLPSWAGIAIQIGLLYVALDIWGSLNDYRELVLIFMGINVMLSVSLNLVNGYMGEFSVGHAGFMAVGAYVASILTMWLFTDEKVFGDAVLPTEWGLPIGFIIALIAGGAAAAVAGLLVAFPSFKTRGDYLAIVTLAVNFIVTGVINNIEAIGGPRGLKGVPLWTDLSWVFAFTVISVIAIHNLVNSTFGKGIIAIREDEISAELMGVNTRHVKLVAFLVSSFIAGMSGGLFAHVLAYVNPGTFGIMKSTEALVMVYLGGMGSISGSIIAAVIFTILIEAFRPLAILKWVVIPLILILLMLYRPQGLFGFREINLNLGGTKDDTPQEALKEAHDDAAAD